MNNCEKFRPLRYFIALYIIVILSACTIIMITGRDNRVEDCSAIDVDTKKEAIEARPILTRK